MSDDERGESGRNLATENAKKYFFFEIKKKSLLSCEILPLKNL
jgi:hypothetical protein